MAGRNKDLGVSGSGGRVTGISHYRPMAALADPIWSEMAALAQRGSIRTHGSRSIVFYRADPHGDAHYKHRLEALPAGGRMVIIPIGNRCSDSLHHMVHR